MADSRLTLEDTLIFKFTEFPDEFIFIAKVLTDEPKTFKLDLTVALTEPFEMLVSNIQTRIHSIFNLFVQQGEINLVSVVVFFTILIRK